MIVESMETEPIIEKVKSLCFSENLAHTLNEMLRIHQHDYMTNELANMLKNNSYDVVSEYQVTYGRQIDLMAFRDSQSIAIEFDNGLHLKFNSIEKLLHSDAKILIGIVKGRRNSPELLDENKLRILSKMKELYIINKKILLIIMSEKVAINASL